MKLTKRGKTVRNLAIVILILFAWEGVGAVADGNQKIEEPTVSMYVDFPLEAWTPDIARAYSEFAIAEYGWGKTQFECLDGLWTRESHWNWKAIGATKDYGIPQRHMSKDTKVEIKDFMSEPIGQIQWGLNYIKSRYETPCRAKAHSDKTGWY